MPAVAMIPAGRKEPDMADSPGHGEGNIAAESLLARFRAVVPSELRKLQDNERRFNAHLRQRWARAFDLYDQSMLFARYAGATFNARHNAQAVERQDLVFEVLMRLHTRACVTTSEVRALLV